MPVHNAEIAEAFERLADLLEIDGANPFRIRAYRNAARTITGLSRNLSDLVADGEDLTELPGIGDAIAAKIETLVKTGRLPKLEEVRARVPAALSDLMKIEGLGPKRVQTLYRELNIRSIEDLERAASSGRIRELEGYGEKTEATILQHAEQYRSRAGRMRLADADEYVATLVSWLRKAPGVGEIAVAGSYRRQRDTVGDIDILVTADRGQPVVDHFCGYDEVTEVVSRGGKRSTVILRAGLQVDLRVVPKVSYGAALCYFTGSRAHNIALRRLAQQRGLKINEYGVFRDEERIGGKTEEEVYRAVGLPWIVPELRENRGEIDAAARGALPSLVSAKDIRGDLHCHTDASDGRNSLRDMAEAAKVLGYEYIAITDHSQHVTVAHGLDKARLLEQIRQIDRLNARLDGVRILKSAEVDILEDGTLDLPDSVLRELDFTLCAVHYALRLPRKKQTERIIRAMDNRHFSILAHPSGRLINEREGYDVDMASLLAAARERGCVMEVNSQPARLDLNDEHCLMAKETGVKVAISTDAHSVSQLSLMRFGVAQARRGWLEPGDVLNSRGLTALLKRLRRS